MVFWNSRNYIPYEKEITKIAFKHCNYYGTNPTEPCWGQVVEETVHLPNFRENPEGELYYFCQGHYDCIEGGSYEPEATN